MKRILPLAAFLLTTVFGHAQNWCPPGATWTYMLSSWSAQGCSQFTYEGDTLFAGAPCQRIVWRLLYHDFVTETNVDEVYDTLYTTVDADLVRIWDGTAFDTLYDFGAVAGDSWQLSLENGDPDGWTMTVQDTGTRVIDGQALHYQVIAQDPFPIDTVYERIGGLTLFMVPWWNGTVDGLSGPLRCYSDADMGYTAPWWTFGCTSLNGIAEEGNSAPPVAHPNPGTDHFLLELPAGAFTLELFSATGQRVGMEHITGGSTRVDTPALVPGLFTYRITTPDGASVARGNWIKE